MSATPRQIALVCDPTEYWELVKALLEKGGYEPVRVGPDELLESAAVQTPAVVILELQDGGLELAPALRADPRTRSLGILGIGRRHGLTRSHVLDRGVNRVVFKPFSPGRFLAEVSALAEVPERFAFQLDFTLKKTRPQKVSIKGFTIDVSTSGMLVWCESPLKVGHNFQLEGAHDEHAVAVEVTVVREASELGAGYYGLQFRRGQQAGTELLEDLGQLQRQG